MVEVFSLMPELDMMVKNELPPKKYECQAFTEFVYRLGISIPAFQVNVSGLTRISLWIPMTDNLHKKNYQKCLIELIVTKMDTYFRKI